MGYYQCNTFQIKWNLLEVKIGYYHIIMLKLIQVLCSKHSLLFQGNTALYCNYMFNPVTSYLEMLLVVSNNHG